MDAVGTGGCAARRGHDADSPGLRVHASPGANFVQCMPCTLYPCSSQVYAWKLLALEDALRRAPAVLWLDAGSTVVAPLGAVGDALLADGYFLVQVPRAQSADEIRQCCSEAVSVCLQLPVPPRSHALFMAVQQPY